MYMYMYIYIYVYIERARARTLIEGMGLRESEKRGESETRSADRDKPVALECDPQGSHSVTSYEQGGLSSYSPTSRPALECDSEGGADKASRPVAPSHSVSRP